MLGRELPFLPCQEDSSPSSQEETHKEMHELRFSVETVATVSNREAGKPGSAAQAGTRPREE